MSKFGDYAGYNSIKVFGKYLHNLGQNIENLQVASAIKIYDGKGTLQFTTYLCDRNLRS